MWYGHEEQYYGMAMKSATMAMENSMALTLGHHMVKGHGLPLLNHEELIFECEVIGH